MLLLGSEQSMDRLHIEWNRLPLDDPQCVLRTMPQARPQTVTIDVSHEPHFTVDDLQGTLRTVWDAEAAAVTFLLIDLDYLSDSGIPSLTQVR
jgi:hypothetical protein